MHAMVPIIIDVIPLTMVEVITRTHDQPVVIIDTVAESAFCLFAEIIRIVVKEGILLVLLAVMI